MALDKSSILGFIDKSLTVIAKSKDLTIIMLIISVIAIIIVPMSSVILDFLLTISISLAILTILVSVYIQRPTDFTTFPTLILIITLFRLSLNIATTRMILSKGHLGVNAVSDIIESFGSFVIGGNYVIGTIIFLILVIINFMVVTKGSGRVAEVAARFTLDAMPGKQMAIDADLNAGLIDEKVAQSRRARILQDANFYGAMDGSSKFVKGDAVAGIIITIINIIGGILIGSFQFGLSINDSVHRYTVLTIGDGLVSQIPALIISTATGIMITRATKDDDEEGNNFAKSSINQLMSDYKVLTMVGLIIVLASFVPGMPTFSFLFVGGIFLLMGYMMYRQQSNGNDLISKFFRRKSKDGEEIKSVAEVEKEEEEKEESLEEKKKSEEKALDEILKVEMLELNVGYQLIRLADENQGGDLLEKIKNIRRTIATQFGFLMPQVRIRDNLQLEPLAYTVLLKGIEIGSGTIHPDRFLAMESGMTTDKVEGIETKEPAFGLDAIWVNADNREKAVLNGYTVVDPSTVISTHVSELVKRNAEDMLTRQETKDMIDKLAENNPILVDEITKNPGNIGIVQKVLRELLKDAIPLKDLLTIVETIADLISYTTNIDVMVDHVRSKLARTISHMYADPVDGSVKLISLEQSATMKLLEHIKQDEDGTRELLLSAEDIGILVDNSAKEVARISGMGISPVIMIVDVSLRKVLTDIFDKFNISIAVISFSEILTTTKYEVLGSVSLDREGEEAE